MHIKKLLPPNSPGWMSCSLALLLLSGCASQPLKCEYPLPPAALMQPPPSEDQLKTLGQIFDQDWSPTADNVKDSDSK
jgi:hypothetical protein